MQIEITRLFRSVRIHQRDLQLLGIIPHLRGYPKINVPRHRPVLLAVHQHIIGFLRPILQIEIIRRRITHQQHPQRRHQTLLQFPASTVLIRLLRHLRQQRLRPRLGVLNRDHVRIHPTRRHQRRIKRCCRRQRLRLVAANRQQFLHRRLIPILFQIINPGLVRPERVTRTLLVRIHKLIFVVRHYPRRTLHAPLTIHKPFVDLITNRIQVITL